MQATPAGSGRLSSCLYNHRRPHWSLTGQPPVSRAPVNNLDGKNSLAPPGRPHRTQSGGRGTTSRPPMTNPLESVPRRAHHLPYRGRVMAGRTARFPWAELHRSQNSTSRRGSALLAPLRTGRGPYDGKHHEPKDEAHEHDDRRLRPVDRRRRAGDRVPYRAGYSQRVEVENTPDHQCPRRLSPSR